MELCQAIKLGGTAVPRCRSSSQRSVYQTDRRSASPISLPVIPSSPIEKAPCKFSFQRTHTVAPIAGPHLSFSQSFRVSAKSRTPTGVTYHRARSIAKHFQYKVNEYKKSLNRERYHYRRFAVCKSQTSAAATTPPREKLSTNRKLAYTRDQVEQL